MLELITSGKNSMDDIINAIYKDIHPGLHNTARRQIQAHINKLIEEKRIEQSDIIYKWLLLKKLCNEKNIKLHTVLGYTIEWTNQKYKLKAQNTET